MTQSTAFEPARDDASGSHKNPRALAPAERRALQGYRVSQQGEPDCRSCGSISDLKGDPRRGWCLTWSHMVGGIGICKSFTTVSWIDRLPHRINPPAGASCQSLPSAADTQHPEVSSDPTVARDDGGSNPPGRASHVRDTSRASYAALKASGALSRQQLVLMATFDRWPYRSFTRQELRAEVGLDINVVTARVKELIDLGALHETGKRICRVKGTEVHELRAVA